MNYTSIRNLGLSVRGQSASSVLITMLLTTMAMTAFLKMNDFQNQAQRRLASRAGVGDLSQAIDALVGTPQCASTGTYLNNNEIAQVKSLGSTYELASDTLKFGMGGIALSTLPESEMNARIRPQTIDQLSWIPLGGSGPAGSGNVYPFQLIVKFKNPSGAPFTPIQKFLSVFTNAKNEVVGVCSATGSIGKIRKWVDVTKERSFVTEYVNDLPNDLELAVSVYSGVDFKRCEVKLEVDGQIVGYQFINGAGTQMCRLTSTIPPGARYKVYYDLSPSPGENTLWKWSELR